MLEISTQIVIIQSLQIVLNPGISKITIFELKSGFIKDIFKRFFSVLKERFHGCCPGGSQSCRKG